jgi:hypothetical protein
MNILSTRETITQSARIRKRPDGILTMHHLPEIENLSLKEFKYNFDMLLKFQQGLKSPFLLNTVGLERIGREEKTYMRELLPTFANSTAIIFDRHNAVTRMTINLMFYLERPVIPIRIFTDEVKGEQWLKKYL